MRIEKLDGLSALPSSRKLRVAIYARVSSEKLFAEESLENQVQSFIEEIDANPQWELAGTFTDQGISGTKVDRPAFQRMLADCRAGKIDLILTKSFTRFARNTVVLLSTLRELKGLGIDVIFEKDHIRSLSESGEFLITLLAAFAQAESQSASENQRWRIQKMFEQGRLTGGIKMYGYRLTNGTLVVVPEEAEVVRQIYADYISGMGVTAIAKKLNRLHIPTFQEGAWNRTTVQSILVNEKYTGSMLLQKTFCTSYLDTRRRINRGERKRYWVENSHEAIISEKVFERVQKEMHRRAEIAAPKRRIAGAIYPFTGLIRCEKCGRHYRRKIANASSKYEKPIWICSTFNTWGKDACDSQQIPESILIAKTAEVLGTDDLTAAIPAMLEHISVPGPGRLVYVFRDGHRQAVEWSNPSRRHSWTPEMRQKAREYALKQHRKEDT